MSSLFKSLSALFFLTTCFFSIAYSADLTAQSGNLVAKVGNLVITQEDVSLRSQNLMPMQFHGKASPEKVSEIMSDALDQLIVRAYKVQYAINEEISIDGAIFEKAWQERVNKNQQAVESVSAAQLNKFKSYMYLDQLASKAEAVAVDERINVSDDDVAIHYAENKERYFRPKLFTASHVFVKVDPSDPAEEKKEKALRAEKLLERAKAGEDFYDLAYYESDDRSKYVGGSLGSFHAGQTVHEFDAAIQEMQAGEIVGPIRTLYGLHIIKLDSVDDERQMEFDEVAAKIRVTMEEEQRSQLYDEWLSNLKEKYLLERFDR